MGNEAQAIMCTKNNTRILYFLTEDMIELYKEMKEPKKKKMENQNFGV